MTFILKQNTKWRFALPLPLYCFYRPTHGLRYSPIFAIVGKWVTFPDRQKKQAGFLEGNLPTLGQLRYATRHTPQ